MAHPPTTPLVEGGGRGAGGLAWGHGPVGRNICTARKGLRVCRVKNALQTAEDRKSWRKMGLEKIHTSWRKMQNAEKINTITCISYLVCP